MEKKKQQRKPANVVNQDILCVFDAVVRISNSMVCVIALNKSSIQSVPSYMN